jgi:hypothetical protein
MRNSVRKVVRVDLPYEHTDSHDIANGSGGGNDDAEDLMGRADT